MWPSSSSADQGGREKKRTVILLRSVVVVSTSYLVLFAQPQVSAPGIAYILTFLLSNVVLALLPFQLFERPNFSAALLLGDTAAVLVGLYHTVGFSQDFLIVYFFTIFLTTAANSIFEIAIGAGLVSALYGYWLWTSSGHGLNSGEWLRLPFFFIIAIFYAYLTEETKRERRRRQEAEEESQYLRFLLSLGDTFSRRIANRELVGQIGSLVEAALPRLTCEVRLDETVTAAGDATLFLLSAHGRTFGSLKVSGKNGTPLSADEERCCRGVAVAAASALYTAEQVTAAQEGSRVKDEFLGVLSHELRTPLHAILGYLDMLGNAVEASSDEFARESVERLRANACRLQDLVEEMLCFTELRAGKRALQLERVELRDLFDQCRVALEDQLAGRPIRFEWDVDHRIVPLQTDRRKLKQMVNGLLNNAAKFTENGFIHLSARLVGDEEVEIAVRDSGVGIDPKDVSLIFEEFRQLDTSLTRRFGGVGLGLSLTQELALTLGGRVAVESESGRGAIFRVRLPVAACPLADAERPLPMEEEALHPAWQDANQ